MATKTMQKQDGLQKLLSYILGFRPDEFGLHPDESGFVPLKALVAALRDEEGWRGLREGPIMMLVNQPGGVSPFEMQDEDIRLKPGLSSLPPQAPGKAEIPKVLYLPLKPAAWPVVHEQGVFPKAPETLVRLWADKDLALKIGRRLSREPVLVTVQAGAAFKAGADFNPYSELLWLTDKVPPRFLSGPPVPPKEERAPKAIVEKEKQPVGSFYIAPPRAQVEVHRGKKQGKHGDSPDWKNQIRRDRRRRDQGHDEQNHDD